jgi:hypothetical protein
MQTMSGVATALVTELRDRLQAGGLANLGPIRLMSGLFADAELAGRVLLAETDHLGMLAEHTGEPATDDRWALLAYEVCTLLRVQGVQRDGTTSAEPSPRP